MARKSIPNLRGNVIDLAAFKAKRAKPIQEDRGLALIHDPVFLAWIDARKRDCSQSGLPLPRLADLKQQYLELPGLPAKAKRKGKKGGIGASNVVDARACFRRELVRRFDPADPHYLAWSMLKDRAARIQGQSEQLTIELEKEWMGLLEQGKTQESLSEMRRKWGIRA